MHRDFFAMVTGLLALVGPFRQPVYAEWNSRTLPMLEQQAQRVPAELLAGNVEADKPADRSGKADSPPPEPPVENRDFDRPQRASPEAANDLFQLLKQAGPKQTPKPK